MSLLLGCQALGKSFGSQRLFEGVSLTISEGDRIGLIGPNGSGKSTLLRILAGELTAADGSVVPRKSLRLGYVAQQDTLPGSGSVRDALVSAIGDTHETDAERDARIHVTLGRAGFADPAQPVAVLSGGWRKRLAIAMWLIRGPELLLLDEPTNHLDIEGVLWLEKLLAAAPFASLVVTHDRYFLERFATRIVEIRRSYPGGTLSADGDYGDFLLRRDEFEQAQAQQRQSLENRVRREVEWLRRGAKARTTKSKARISAAGQMIEELDDLVTRSATRTASIDFTATGRRTKRLIEADGLAAKADGRVLFEGVCFTLSPGSRLGLLGPNGCGKTTLLRILEGTREPDSGIVRRAEGLRVLHFDQHRETLDASLPLRRALAPHGDSVVFQGRPVHVAGWAARFLFRNDQLDLPLERLSGGERARVHIARLMLEEADVLLLDEPANDLDIPTLEVLEDNLASFAGAVVLVTHDRYLLDRINTVILGLDGRGGSGMFATCEQWERERSSLSAPRPSQAPEPARNGRAKETAPTPKKLSYLEQREWEQMEARILEAEQRLQAAEAELLTVEGSYDARRMRERHDNFESARSAVETLYARWAELEAKLTN